MFPVELWATEIVFPRGQRLHMTLVFSIFFMKCFQTSERPCGKYQSCINRSRVICVSWFRIINKNGTFRFVSKPYKIYSPEYFNMITASQFGALGRDAATCFQLQWRQQKWSSTVGNDCTWTWSGLLSSWYASKLEICHAESTSRLDRVHECLHRSHPASVDPGW